MTVKEFKEHEWKVGERLYRVVYKTLVSSTWSTFYCYEIPYKVCPIHVDFVGFTQNVIGLKVAHNMIDYLESRSGINLKYYFFNKKDAVKQLEKEKKRFVEYNRDTLRRNLIQRRSQIFKDARRELNKINGILRMKIMNE